MDVLSSVLVGVYFTAAVLLALYGLNCYVMMALFVRRNRRRKEGERLLLERFRSEVHDEDLPVVTTQLPIFNESNVVERLVRAVCAFDYPKGKHEVQVLDDSTDETTELVAELVAELQMQGHDVQHIHRTHRAGFKAGALEEGLKVARGEHLAVFDADFVPPPDFLRRTIPFLVMEPRCGFVQTRWGHRNKRYSLLTFAQSIGIDGHFVVEQSARAWNWLFLNFNGTAGVWRKSAIEQAGGWSPDTLTEDLDLSYRTQLAGWKARFLFDVVTPAEIPTNINALKSQQFRWAKGSIQTALKLLPAVLRRRDVGLFKKLEAVLHLTHYMVHPLIITMSLLVLPVLVFGQRAITMAVMIPLLVIMLLALFAPSSLYLFSQRVANRETWKETILYLPALMALGVGLAVNNTRAVIEAFTGRRSEFIRTPKLGTAAESKAPILSVSRPDSPPSRGVKVYQQPLLKIFWLEILMGAWCFLSFTFYLKLAKFLVGPILLIHSLGFTYVGVISYLHDLRTRQARARL